MFVELSEFLRSSEESEASTLAVVQAAAIAKNLAPHHDMCRPSGKAEQSKCNPSVMLIHVCMCYFLGAKEKQEMRWWLSWFNLIRIGTARHLLMAKEGSTTWAPNSFVSVLAAGLKRAKETIKVGA